MLQALRSVLARHSENPQDPEEARERPCLQDSEDETIPETIIIPLFSGGGYCAYRCNMGQTCIRKDVHLSCKRVGMMLIWTLHELSGVQVTISADLLPEDMPALQRMCESKPIKPQTP